MGGVEPLAEGSRAPTFALKDQNDSTVKLTDLKSRYVVLFFYPKDNTPGCSIEAKGFSENRDAFDRLNASVIGISGGDVKSKQRFCTKFNLNLTLLADEDFQVATDFGVYGPKTFMGRVFSGIHRMTFVLDDKQKILRVFKKVKPAVHPAEVLEYLESLSDG